MESSSKAEESASAMAANTPAEGAETMATSQPCPDPPDDDLSELLDSALKDFKQPKKERGTTTADSTTRPLNVAEAGAEDDGEFPFHMSKEMAQKAAKDFQLMLRQLAEVQETLLEQQDVGGATSSESAPTGDMEASLSQQQQAEQMLENFKQLSETAGKVAEAETDEEFANRLKELQGDEESAELDASFMPFMYSLLTSVMSKSAMYPSMLELKEKYPAWLKANSGGLPPAELLRYKRQQEIVGELCRVYEQMDENEGETAADAVPTDDTLKKYEQVMLLMQKMHACGLPPEELLGEMPAGWSLDAASQLPSISDPAKAASNCPVQ